MKIEKSKLSKFIEKYNLNGTVDSVKYTFNSKESTLETAVYAPDKTLMGKVTVANVKSDEDLTIGIYETEKLKKLLGPMVDGELEVTPTKSDDGTRVTSLLLLDGDNIPTNFVTSDLSAIPIVPNLKKVPPFGIEIEISKEFTTNFIKRKNSLEKIETFTLVPDKTSKILIVLGYAEKINSNNVKIPVKCVAGKDELSKVLSFSAGHLENIFKANEDAFTKADSTILLKVSEAGLAHVEIEAGDFKSEYFLTLLAQK